MINEIPGEKTFVTLFTSSQMNPSHCPLQGLFIAWVFSFVQIHVPRWPPRVKPSPSQHPILPFFVEQKKGKWEKKITELTMCQTVA